MWAEEPYERGKAARAHKSPFTLPHPTLHRKGVQPLNLQLSLQEIKSWHTIMSSSGWTEGGQWQQSNMEGQMHFFPHITALVFLAAEYNMVIVNTAAA